MNDRASQQRVIEVLNPFKVLRVSVLVKRT